MLIDAQSWDRMSRLALSQAPGLMSQGRHGTLRNWLDRIPSARMQDDPWLLYWLGASRDRLWQEYLDRMQAAGASREAADNPAAPKQGGCGSGGCGHH